MKIKLLQLLSFLVLSIPVYGINSNLDSLVKNANIDMEIEGCHIYLNNNILIYVVDTATTLPELFFVHVYPVDINNLADDRKVHEFEIRDIDTRYEYMITNIAPYGVRKVYLRELPAYPILNIVTGSYTNNTTVWYTNIYVKSKTATVLSYFKSFYIYFLIFAISGIIIYRNRKDFLKTPA